MSWFNLNYVFGESSGNNTSTLILERSVDGSIVPDSYDGSVKDNHEKEVLSGFRSYHKEPLLPDLNETYRHLLTVSFFSSCCGLVPSDDYSYRCPGYASYGQENYGNNFFISDAYPVQQDVGEPSYVQESLVDEQHAQQDIGGPSYAQESLGDEQPAYPDVLYKIDQV
ncbi:hypothetical protein Hanom_Chr08g00734281 [Helianthus anomalus]